MPEGRNEFNRRRRAQMTLAKRLVSMPEGRNEVLTKENISWWEKSKGINARRAVMRF
jgi:hypothetical protein